MKIPKLWKLHLQLFTKLEENLFYSQNVTLYTSTRQGFAHPFAFDFCNPRNSGDKCLGPYSLITWATYII